MTTTTKSNASATTAAAPSSAMSGAQMLTMTSNSKTQREGAGSSDLNLPDGESTTTDDSTVKKNGKGKKGAGKTVVAIHKRKKRIRSQVAAQASIADSISKLSKTQEERWENAAKHEAERAKEVLEFKREQAQKDREHEKEMAKIWASMFTQIRSPISVEPRDA